MGLPISGTPSDTVGGLVPVSIANSNSEVEEMRYESFAVHNWQLNDRMSLESTLLLETSEITQSGDVHLSRNFEFLRPKVDYRFNITSMLQFRAGIERDVSSVRRWTTPTWTRTRKPAIPRSSRKKPGFTA